MFFLVWLSSAAQVLKRMVGMVWPAQAAFFLVVLFQGLPNFLVG